MSAYRDDEAALATRQTALANEVKRTQRELDEVDRLLAGARGDAPQRPLDNVRAASPCSELWSSMTGDARVRSCGTCSKYVYDVTGLTRREAERLVTDTAGGPCAQYYQRADGTILLADCELGASRAARRRRAVVSMVALAGGLGALIAIGSSVQWDPGLAATEPAPSARATLQEEQEHARWRAETTRALHRWKTEPAPARRGPPPFLCWPTMEELLGSLRALTLELEGSKSERAMALAARANALTRAAAARRARHDELRAAAEAHAALATHESALAAERARVTQLEDRARRPWAEPLAGATFEPVPEPVATEDTGGAEHRR